MRENKEEACELKNRVDALDGRITAVESSVAEMRSESQEGFSRVTDALNSLGHDFGERMTALDNRINEDKIEWGKCLRRIVSWAAAGLIVLAGAAAGLNLAKMIFDVK